MPLVPPSPALAQAEQLVRLERYAAAVQAFAALDPSDPRVERGLGRALAGAGRCRDALPHLAHVRAAGAWTATDAYFEGTCHERQGDLPDAVAAWTEAVSLDEAHALSWYRLARAADRLGDSALAGEARDRLWTLDAGPTLVILADARRDVLAGDPDADLRLSELVGARGDPRFTGEIALLDGRRWLDLGWPEAAIRSLVAAVRARPSDLEAATLLARAFLAAGDPDRARDSLDRPWIALQDPTPELEALERELGR